MDSQEAAAWLRLLLHGDSNVNPEKKVSSHSLKTTMLSYAARRGLGMDIRLQLGYHTSSHRMGLTYSRDGAAASLMALEQMLCEINTGLYSPDETRSGRIRTQPEIATSAVIEVKDEALDSEQVHAASHDVNETDESSYSSSTGDSAEEDDYEPRGDGTKMFSVPEAPEGFVLWQHSKSRVLHLMADNYFRVFVCGRVAGEFHVNSGLTPRYDTPVCGL